MKKLLCLCLALCLLACLAACKKIPAPVPATHATVTTTAAPALDPAFLSDAQAAATPGEAAALLPRLAALSAVPDEVLKAFVSTLRRTAYEFTEEYDWAIPAEKDPKLPLFYIAVFDEGGSSELCVAYNVLEEALRGRLTEGGAAWLAELIADGAEELWVNGYLQVSFDEFAAIIVRKATFETKYPGFVTQWDDETPGWEYFTTAKDLLEEYLHGNKTVGHPGSDFRNGPIDAEVRASFEAFLANAAYRDCVYYDAVQAVADLLEGNNWEYDYELREEIDLLLAEL